MKTILITDVNTFDINEEKPTFVAEELGHFGDNGGDPDGNAWLPMNQLSDEAQQWLIENGHGEMVEAMSATDEAIARLGGLMLSDGWNDDDDIIDALRDIAGTHSAGWAHYGSYGVSDSTWIYIPL